MSDSSAGILSEKEARALGHTGPARVADYIALLKPRVMSLVVFTGLVGMVCAPGYLHPVLGFVAIFCIAVGAGASGALNMWFDADIDARMSRTKERPIPAGRITPGEALGLGTALSVASVLMMGLFVNVLAAGLLALTIGFYLFVYTMWLKRRTPQNIVIGGAAGALPPVIGWAAVTGSLSLDPVLLFAIIFMWTPPHFWALSLFKSDDYERVGVPMMPVVAGDAATRRQIMIYSLILVPLAVTPVLTGLGGWLYGATSIGLGAGFLYFAAKVWIGATGSPMRLFGFSILYLFLLFAALLVEHLIGWV